MNIIEVKDLNLWYGANQALKDAGLDSSDNLSFVHETQRTMRW